MNNKIDTEKNRSLLEKAKAEMVERMGHHSGQESDGTQSITKDYSVYHSACDYIDQVLSLLPPPCEMCGGSGKVPTPQSIGFGKENQIMQDCPACSPAGKVEEFLALLQKERNCWSEHNSTGQIIEKACTHLTAQAKTIREQETRLAIQNSRRKSDYEIGGHIICLEDKTRMQAKQIKDLEDGAFAANEEAQIRNDQIEQLKNKIKELEK